MSSAADYLISKYAIKQQNYYRSPTNNFVQPTAVNSTNQGAVVQPVQNNNSGAASYLINKYKGGSTVVKQPTQPIQYQPTQPVNPVGASVSTAPMIRNPLSSGITNPIRTVQNNGVKGYIARPAVNNNQANSPTFQQVLQQTYNQTDYQRRDTVMAEAVLSDPDATREQRKLAQDILKLNDDIDKGKKAGIFGTGIQLDSFIVNIFRDIYNFNKDILTGSSDSQMQRSANYANSEYMAALQAEYDALKQKQQIVNGNSWVLDFANGLLNSLLYRVELNVAQKNPVGLVALLIGKTVDDINKRNLDLVEYDPKTNHYQVKQNMVDQLNERVNNKGKLAQDLVLSGANQLVNYVIEMYVMDKANQYIKQAGIGLSKKALENPVIQKAMNSVAGQYMWNFSHRVLNNQTYQGFTQFLRNAGFTSLTGEQAEEELQHVTEKYFDQLLNNEELQLKPQFMSNKERIMSLAIIGVMGSAPYAAGAVSTAINRKSNIKDISNALQSEGVSKKEAEELAPKIVDGAVAMRKEIDRQVAQQEQTQAIPQQQQPLTSTQDVQIDETLNVDGREVQSETVSSDFSELANTQIPARSQTYGEVIESLESGNREQIRTELAEAFESGQIPVSAVEGVKLSDGLTAEQLADRFLSQNEVNYTTPSASKTQNAKLPTSQAQKTISEVEPTNVEQTAQNGGNGDVVELTDEQIATQSLSGLPKEANEVYREVLGQFSQSGNAKITKAQQMNAALLARYANRWAENMNAGEKTDKYTAKDFLDKLKIKVDQKQSQESNGNVNNQVFNQEVKSQSQQVREQYEGTGQWLKAPNGEKTNLTEEQWLAVRTEAFKKWFGDWENDPENASKVVDENGEPLVVYHGTPNGEKSQFRSNNYFTQDKEYASIYQNPEASSLRPNKKITTPKVFDVFLDIKNPFTLRNNQAKEIYIKEYAKSGESLSLNPSVSVNEYYKLLANKEVDWTEAENLSEWLEKNYPEFDGIIADEGGVLNEKGEVIDRGISYITFNPTQIKSVDNKGTFSSEDANIYNQATSNQIKGQAVIDQTQRVIKLFETADESTFAHELGHIALTDLKTFAEMDGATQQQKQDWQTVANWVGYKPSQKDFTVKQQEKFAQGFEAWLRTGETQITGLRGVFKRFSKWLGDLYKTYKELGGKPPKAVRNVMERMLATQSEIDQANSKKVDTARKVKVDQDNLPVKSQSGQKRASGLEARLTGVSAKDLLEYAGQTYDTSTNKEQLEKAAQFIEKDPDGALAALLGSRSIPSGTTRGALLKMYGEYALINGREQDYQAARALTSMMSTRMGQEIQSLSLLSEDDPINQINQIQNLRIEEFAKKNKSNVEAVKKTIEKKTSEYMSEYSKELKRQTKAEESHLESVLREVIC